MEQGDALSPLSNFPLEFGIRKMQDTNIRLDMNGTYQVLPYTDYVNLIGDDIRIERNAGVLLNACKDFGLAVNTGKTKYIEISSRYDGK